ncbi:MAG: RHS repeat-associated core domain-containing protein [Armatimonadota bacterium]
MATLAGDATLNTYTYDSDGFKKVENLGGSLSTIIWDGTDYLQVRGTSTIKTFHTVESQMMSYIESTLRYDFLTDQLGSITAIMDGNQTRIFDTRYSAYGRNLWATGTGCGFGWVGSYGYKETGLVHMSHYVRARHYSYVTGAWSTVDPLWPDESARGYVRGRATSNVDPSGLASCNDDPCGDATSFCNRMWRYGNDKNGKPRQGAVLCCDGKKITCIFDFNLPTGTSDRIKSCIRKHEETHHSQCSCPKQGAKECLPPDKTSLEEYIRNECNGYAVEIDCYANSRKECDKLQGWQKVFCLAEIEHWIKDSCKFQTLLGCRKHKECK